MDSNSSLTHYSLLFKIPAHSLTNKQTKSREQRGFSI